jgi:hypothetical protein
LASLQIVGASPGRILNARGGPRLRAMSQRCFAWAAPAPRRVRRPCFKAHRRSPCRRRRRRASNAVHTGIRYSYHFFSKILTPLLACPAAEDNRFAGPGSSLIRRNASPEPSATGQQVADRQSTLLCAARGGSVGCSRAAKNGPATCSAVALCPLEPSTLHWHARYQN